MENQQSSDEILLQTLFALQLKLIDPKVLEQIRQEIKEINNAKQRVNNHTEETRRLLERISCQPSFKALTKTQIQEIESCQKALSDTLREHIFSTESAKRIIRDYQDLAIEQTEPPEQNELLLAQQKVRFSLDQDHLHIKEKTEQVSRNQASLKNIAIRRQEILDQDKVFQASNESEKSKAIATSQSNNNQSLKRSQAVLESQARAQKLEESKKVEEPQIQKKKHLVIMFEQTGRSEMIKFRSYFEKAIKEYLGNLMLNKVSLVLFDNKEKMEIKDIDRDLKNFKLPPLQKSGYFPSFWSLFNIESYNVYIPNIWGLLDQLEKDPQINSSQYETQGLLIFENSEQFKSLNLNPQNFIKTQIIGIGNNYPDFLRKIALALNGSTYNIQTKIDYFYKVEDKEDIDQALKQFSKHIFKEKVASPIKKRDIKNQPTSHIADQFKKDKLSEKNRQEDEKWLFELQIKENAEDVRRRDKNLNDLYKDEQSLKKEIENLNGEIEQLKIQLKETEKKDKEIEEKLTALFQAQQKQDKSTFIKPADIRKLITDLTRFIEDTQRFKNEKTNFIRDVQQRLNQLGLVPQEQNRQHQGKVQQRFPQTS